MVHGRLLSPPNDLSTQERPPEKVKISKNKNPETRRHTTEASSNSDSVRRRSDLRQTPSIKFPSYKPVPTWTTGLLSSRISARQIKTLLGMSLLRRGSFIEKMVGMGWTVGGRLDTGEFQAALVHCIARYHSFLWLMSGQPGRPFVPTLVCHPFATQESTCSDLAA